MNSAGRALAQERPLVVGVGELKPALVRAVDALAGQTSRRRGSIAGGSGVTAAGAWPVGKGANVKLVATSAETVMLPYTTEPELPRSFLGRMVAHLSNT